MDPTVDLQDYFEYSLKVKKKLSKGPSPRLYIDELDLPCHYGGLKGKTRTLGFGSLLFPHVDDFTRYEI
jgi:hypothetical protein